MAEDASIKKATAEAIVERARGQLRDILPELMRRLDPFPEFIGSGMLALKVEPGIAKNRDRGCVVVCPDGELYELWISTDFSSRMPKEFLKAQPEFDPTSVFQVEIKTLDLTPLDYIVYAYNAICALTEILERRQSA